MKRARPPSPHGAYLLNFMCSLVQCAEELLFWWDASRHLFSRFHHRKLARSGDGPKEYDVTYLSENFHGTRLQAMQKGLQYGLWRAGVPRQL